MGSKVKYAIFNLVHLPTRSMFVVCLFVVVFIVSLFVCFSFVHFAFSSVVAFCLSAI